MSVKLDAGSTSSTSFKLDNLDYPKGICEIIYSNVVKDGSGNIDEDILKVGLRNVNTGAQIQRPLLIKDWINSSDVAYSSLSSLLTDLTSLAFKQGGGNGSSGVTITQTANNYSSLSSGTTVGDLAYVYNSQGTAWLPGSLGGTFYPKGFYVWDGLIWVSDRNAIANQLQQNVEDILDLQTEIALALQSGDNISELVNDAGYITSQIDRLEEDSTVTGTKNIDWGSYETFYYTLTGACTFSDTNLPSSGSKTITIYMIGDFAPTYPTGWDTYISGTYDGTVLNTIVVEYVKASTPFFKVQISQPD